MDLEIKVKNTLKKTAIHQQVIVIAVRKKMFICEKPLSANIQPSQEIGRASCRERV